MVNMICLSTPTISNHGTCMQYMVHVQYVMYGYVINSSKQGLAYLIADSTGEVKLPFRQVDLSENFFYILYD